MTKYIAFLRGINVGNIRIKMSDLKTAFEGMGFTQVRTFLQSGNVVFEATTTASDVKSTLEKGLSAAFHYEAYVLIYPFSVLADFIANYPMARRETHHAYVIFIENEAAFKELCGLAESISNDMEKIVPGNGVLYWETLRGESTDTPFSKLLAKAKYKSTTTVRNVNTLEKMV